MKSGFQDDCDLFIRRCQDVLAMEDIHEARKILVEATSVFEEAIPNWNGGLMSEFTGFYLDDAQMVLGKLSAYRANGYQVIPRDFLKTNHNEKVIEPGEYFDAAILEIRSAASANGWMIEPIIVKLQELQAVCTSRADLSERWPLLKPYIEWATLLDAELAKHILPLIIRSVK